MRHTPAHTVARCLPDRAAEAQASAAAADARAEASSSRSPAPQRQQQQEARAGAHWGKKHPRGGIGYLWLEVFCTHPDTGGGWVHLDVLQGWVDACAPLCSLSEVCDALQHPQGADNAPRARVGGAPLCSLLEACNALPHPQRAVSGPQARDWGYCALSHRSEPAGCAEIIPTAEWEGALMMLARVGHVPLAQFGVQRCLDTPAWRLGIAVQGAALASEHACIASTASSCRLECASQQSCQGPEMPGS